MIIMLILLLCNARLVNSLFQDVLNAIELDNMKMETCMLLLAIMKLLHLLQRKASLMLNVVEQILVKLLYK